MTVTVDDSRYTVMVVNDSPFIVDVFIVMLERHGHRVIPAYDSVEALEYLKKERPDIILTNIMRSDIDGWEFTEMVKSNPETKEIPVVITSAHPYTDKDQRRYGHLIEEYAPLPIAHNELHALVVRVMENWKEKKRMQ